MKTSHLLNYLFILFITLLFIFGSVGSYTSFSIPLSIACTVLFIGTRLITGEKLEIPKNFTIYILFLFTLLIHSLLTGGEAIKFLIFFSGGLYWFLIYNLRNLVSKYFPYFLIFLGLVMTFLYLTAQINNVSYLPQGSLILPLSSKVLHNHLGDLWAVILVALFYLMLTKKQKLYLPLIVIGLILIGISLSRSALLSLIAGTYYIFHNLPTNKNHKQVFFVITVIALLLFLYFGAYKTTLFSRPYFSEGLTSLINAPLGTGVGNFDQVSTESSLAHNILIEIVTGMGIFSVVFILWLVKVFKSFLKNNTNLLYKALFIAIFVNFCFDTTYTIPAMIWIWFSTLALTSYIDS